MLKSFAVRLHAAHLPPAGLACSAHFIGSVLKVEGSTPQQVPVQALSVTTGGFDDDLLFLNWEAGGIRYSAIPADTDARRTLLTSAPPSLLPQLQRGQGVLGRQRFKWNFLLGALVVFALVLGFAWWQSDALAAWLAGKVPLATEQKLGESTLAELKEQGGLTDQGAAADAVKAIGSRLTQGSRYTYRWYVKDDDSINAFAMPGGIVVVHSGLIEKAESPEELAGVLAHEVQHVERRHSLQQLIHTAGWAAVLAVTLGDVSAITGVVIHQMGNLRHSRKLEAEADAEGVKALAKAGIAPKGMATFFKKLAAEKQDEGEIALLSSHPATAERLASIEALVARTPCACKPLAYDWKAVQAAAREGAKPSEPDAKKPTPAPAGTPPAKPTT